MWLPKVFYEREIYRRFFIENNIDYVRQFSFEDCIYKHRLKFDFAIFKNDDLLILIEYDGQQHFRPVDFAGRGKKWADLQYAQNSLRDSIKNNYCRDNNIPLFRIPYTFSNQEIKEKLTNIIYP